ncbi:MAG TPA: hypothetical protein VFY47_08440 [Thermoleophilaceae bacterium]|nr:hypothetical protein [Thermoleophilaceae bacterium]
MTTKTEFNAEEWDRLAQAPALAGVLVIMADRGGTIRESIALGKAYAAARRDGGSSELLEQVVATAPQVDPASLGPADQLRQQLPERIREAVGILEEKATPEEAEEYRQFILRVADVVARANKEGGVLGIGGEEVSEEEQAALDELARALEPSAT